MALLDGTVMHYDAKLDMGKIKSHGFEEKDYNFGRMHWQSKEYPPKRGLIVEFDPAGTVATKILVVGFSSTIS